MENGLGYLQKNLCDSIFEMMLKLNESQSSSICIYYTPDLMTYLIGCDFKALNQKLAEFKNYAEKYIGDIDIEKATDGRYGIKVYSNGIDTIMKSNPRRFFLKKLIEAVRDRNSSIEQIKEIFAEESKDYVYVKIDDSEFQYVVYFNDENIDEYRYCFTFDAMGSYYHRLIEYDYENLIHNSCGLKH